MERPSIYDERKGVEKGGMELRIKEALHAVNRDEWQRLADGQWKKYHAVRGFGYQLV